MEPSALARETVHTSELRRELSVARMLADAESATGLSDFGPPAFIEGLNVLVESATEELEFHRPGLLGFRADIHRLLVNRLRFEEDMRRHPEILGESVSDPIVILGLVRTGTSKLQRMMSADPQVQKLYFWRLFNPAPFPGSRPGEEDPRIEVARQASRMLAAVAPEFMAAHPTLAEDVDEELLLLEFSFKTIVHYIRTPAPGYYAWLSRQSLRDSYEDLGRLVRYLQWQDGGRQGRPWVMKSPAHLGNLELLAGVFPNATLVHCHRDVAEVIASFSGLGDATWRLKTLRYTKAEVGPAMLSIWSAEMDKYLRSRERMPGLSILDVHYDEITRDPVGVIREIYRRAGLPLGDASLHAMLSWNEANPKDRFGRHIYSLEDYGLDAQTVERAFAGYIERFGALLQNSRI